MFNVFDVGELPLAWSTPHETRPDLAAGTVGRAAELAELHKRLHGGGDAAVVSAGATAAVRGQPGIGKTVLAALFANRHAAGYPGGVLWLEVGPQARTAADAHALLRRVIAYAYDRDVRAQWLDRCLFMPEVVRMLLDGHVLIHYIVTTHTTQKSPLLRISLIIRSKKPQVYTKEMERYCRCRRCPEKRRGRTNQRQPCGAQGTPGAPAEE